MSIQALEEEQKKQEVGPPLEFSFGMLNVTAQLEKLFGDAIKLAFPSLTSISSAAITVAQNDKFGDYQCNNAMAVSGVSIV